LFRSYYWRCARPSLGDARGGPRGDYSGRSAVPQSSLRRPTMVAFTGGSCSDLGGDDLDMPAAELDEIAVARVAHQRHSVAARRSSVHRSGVSTNLQKGGGRTTGHGSASERIAPAADSDRVRCVAAAVLDRAYTGQSWRQKRTQRRTLIRCGEQADRLRSRGEPGNSDGRLYSAVRSTSAATETKRMSGRSSRLDVVALPG